MSEISKKFRQYYQKNPGVYRPIVLEAADEIDRLEGELAAARAVLVKIANIAHHGGLMGMDAFTAIKEIRGIALPWWDRDECSRLQKSCADKEAKGVR